MVWRSGVIRVKAFCRTLRFGLHKFGDPSVDSPEILSEGIRELTPLNPPTKQEPGGKCGFAPESQFDCQKKGRVFLGNFLDASVGQQKSYKPSRLSG